MTNQKTEIETLQGQVKSAALELFEGDQQMAESWLSSPLPIIGNETPYNYMDSPERARQLLGIINRFEHGVWT
ncbi:MbcA/ParS/Xre antitoxin family protein [Marinobacter sp. SS8-8]|uniref:MbcA/ParS/Xre antitoxin family protein n=1 Tax=Marinobacter sp. SS8-8 TaxID=3050452 RepID=UPI0026E02166|nr:MbcA/ParS/Xre antitoxin family protein [Marinobacter sp. SS8-8]